MVLDQYFIKINIFYDSIHYFQFILIIISSFFCFLIWTKSKRIQLLRVIGHCSWILSAITLVIVSVLLCCIYFLGSLNATITKAVFSFSDSKLLEDYNYNDDEDEFFQSLTNNVAAIKCFEKNAIDKYHYSKYYNDSLYGKKTLFKNLNNVYESIITIYLYDHFDYFNNLEVLSQLKNYLSFIEDANYAYVSSNLKEDYQNLTKANNEFLRMLDRQSSYPFQAILRCETLTQIQILYDTHFCQVPITAYKNQKTLERHCYLFKNFTEEDLENLIEKLKLKNCELAIQTEPNEITFEDVLRKRFSQLKIFYTRFDKYTEHFYKNVIEK